MEKKEGYDIFGKFYDNFIKQGFPKLHKKYFDFVVKTIKKYSLKPKLILDTACGTGILMNIFKKREYNIIGLENSKTMLKQAKKKGLKVKKGNMVNFKINKKYDLILNFDSLNHITNYSNLKKCFASISNHLRKEGLFIFDIDSKEKIENVIQYKNLYYDLGKYKLTWKNSKKTNLWVVEMEILERQRDGSFKKYKEKHKMRGYSIKQIELALKNAKLKVTQKDKSLIKKNSLIFCCKKG